MSFLYASWTKLFYNHQYCTEYFLIFVRIKDIDMDTKLTLKLDQEIIEKAKKYAADKKVSLSRIIENYLNSLTSDKKIDNDIEISPFIKSIRTGVEIPVDLDYKKEYGDFLAEKYK